MLGTELEAPEFIDGPFAPASVKQRVLILGAGLAGAEVSRLAATRGHEVEIWEKSARAGGQIHLAVAAPDKEEVRPAWSWRWDQVQALGVPVRYGVSTTADAIRAFAPDHVVVATGAKPRPLSLPGAAPLQAWDVIANPVLVPDGARVAVIGGGIVGLEVADVLVQRGCRISILEALPAIAPAMARNNRTDLMIRLREVGTSFHTKVRDARLVGDVLHFTEDGTAREMAGMTHIIAAIGALPNLDTLPVVEASGIPFTVVGDANQPGDFLSVLRDASMVGLALGMQPLRQEHMV
jgi:pyruvate/2-oxoglutarate dehydrogenase complex dihydrolipoamide dehydrogenase (E3) component